MCTARKPTSIDAGIYGFIANIHFFPIPTPLKAFVSAHPNLVRALRGGPRDGEQVSLEVTSSRTPGP